MLVTKSPQLTDELLTVKRSETKWYEHIRMENVSRNREIMDMKDNLMVYVQNQTGIVLEEIAYYLQNLVEEFRDEHLEYYYNKYLSTLKKL